MSKLNNKTIFTTGARRDIGKAIALRFAREGASVVVTGKSIQLNPKVPGTIYSTSHEVEDAGGRALAIQLDDANAVAAAVLAGAETFGGIDIRVNNASAIALTGTLATPVKRYDLMKQTNARATFIRSQARLPHLFQSANPHTAAVEVFFPQALAASRNSSIMADAALAIVLRDSRRVTGNFFIDEEVLPEEGITDLAKYALTPGATLCPDRFLD